jgi:LysR family glycine cleavage system transcriptional activator
MRQAPSMTGLRVLEAVARTGSLSAAARELCVTPAAISHRLRDIEAQSGTRLLMRSGARFVPTETGRSVLEALGDAFTRIRSADAILSDNRLQALRFVGSYSFAVLWLAPRLSRFQDRHPEVKFYLEPSHSPLEQAQADIAIVHATQPPAPTGWRLLFSDRCSAVARAGHPIFRDRAARPEDVFRHKLVHISHERGPEWGEFSWQRWAAALGLSGPVPTSGPTVSAEHLAVELVQAEDAFALVSEVNASNLIANGRLRAVGGTGVPTGCSYWIGLRATENPAGKAASKFLAWVDEELANQSSASG